MLLGPVDLLVFISLITDITSFSEAGFMKKYRSLEIIFVTGVSVDNLTFYITSNCHKEVVKCFSHNFGIRCINVDSILNWGQNNKENKRDCEEIAMWI